jgi:hypothetical protein
MNMKNVLVVVVLFFCHQTITVGASINVNTLYSQRITIEKSQISGFIDIYGYARQQKILLESRAVNSLVAVRPRTDEEGGVSRQYPWIELVFQSPQDPKQAMVLCSEQTYNEVVRIINDALLLSGKR